MGLRFRGLRFCNYFGISVAEQKCRFLKYGTHADARDDVGEECQMKRP